MIWFEESLRENMMAFDALAGCDTTSPFSGIGKKSAWSVFEECPMLLKHLGEAEQPDQDTISMAEKFVCKLYQHSTDKISVNELRNILFNKVDAKIKKSSTNQRCSYTSHKESQLSNIGMAPMLRLKTRITITPGLRLGIN